MYNHIVYRCLRSLDLATSSYASLMIFHRLWSLGVWLPCSTLEQTKGLITQGKPHSLHSIKLGWKPPQAISACIFSHVLFLVSEFQKQESQHVQKNLKGAEQNLLSAQEVCPLQNPQRTWQGSKAEVVKASASWRKKLNYFRELKPSTPPPGNTTRGRALNLELSI